MNRCAWVNTKNLNYVKYHDTVWGKRVSDDKVLYEMFILECFQAGLSWECILNKIDAFRLEYENFDIEKVINFDKNKIEKMLKNPSIIRNKSKIIASIENSKVFKSIQCKFGSFYNYLLTFQSDTSFEEYSLHNSNALSDKISADLKKRGMKFVGTITIYSYLQAIGIINGHGKECDLYVKN